MTDPSLDPGFTDMLKAQCTQTKPFDFKSLDALNATFDSTNKGSGQRVWTV